jgi:antibiotic biosynthesis monooxygenase
MRPPRSAQEGRSHRSRILGENALITRMWRGWTARENADAYERFLLEELFPSMRDIPGFVRAEVLRRDDGDEVAFVTLTRFESLDAVRAFAGESYEVPVLEPPALALLSRWEKRAEHFETATP